MATQLVPEKATPATAVQPVPLAGAMDIPVELIVPSKTNRRQVRHAERDAELAESIRMRGVQQPIVVRPLEEQREAGQLPRYEIICGHRRWEMSKKAGKTIIPAVVRKLNNAEALEIQTIENWQREDLDPLDRAESIHDLYQQYLKAHSPKDALARISERLNCKERTLYNMMSLRNLVPGAQAALNGGQIQPSHAYLLCRLTPELQKKALTWLKGWGNDYRSVRELEGYIKQNILHSLSAAAFKKDDAKLVPEAGACTTCPKNTSVNPDLFPDEKKETCTDPPCYEKKQQAHLVQIEKAAKTTGEQITRVSEEYGNAPTKHDQFFKVGYWKEVGKSSCKSAKPGVVIDGARAGQRIVVCANMSCAVHHPKTSYTDLPRVSAAAVKKERERAERQKVSVEIEKQARFATLQAIAKNVKLDRTVLNAVALDVMKCGDDEIAQFAAEAFGWPRPKRGRYSYNEIGKVAAQRIPKLKDQQLAGIFVAQLVSQELYVWSGGNGSCKNLEAMARRYKVNMGKIRKDLAAAAKAHNKPKAKLAQTSATKKKATAKKKAA